VIARGSVGAVLALLVLVGCADEPDQVPAGRLVEAAARGDAAAVSVLLARGADANERDGNGRSAVTAAVYAGSAEAVRLLVAAGADVDVRDDTKSNAFLALGETGNVAVLDEVLEGDPDVTLTNRYGGTPLIPAAERGHVEMVRALLARTEVDVDHVNDLGWTALLEAVVLGSGGPDHLEIVRLLIAAGADQSVRDNEGVTALEHARAKGFAAIAALLD